MDYLIRKRPAFVFNKILASMYEAASDFIICLCRCPLFEVSKTLKIIYSIGMSLEYCIVNKN